MSIFHPTIRKLNMDTGYAVVRDEFFRGHRVRMLYVDGAMESAIYLEPTLRDAPPFYYQESLLKLMEEEGLRDTLLIGGGGFIFPRAYLKSREDRRIRVVEIEPELLTIAREDFWFDEVYQQEIDKRLFVTIGDGFDYIRETDEMYDLIINDAFAGSTADQGLLMPDSAAEVYQHLNPGGRYMINLVTAKTGEDAMSGQLQTQILESIFGTVEMVPVHPDWKPHEKQNYILIGRKSK